MKGSRDPRRMEKRKKKDATARVSHRVADWADSELVRAVVTRDKKRKKKDSSVFGDARPLRSLIQNRSGTPEFGPKKMRGVERRKKKLNTNFSKRPTPRSRTAIPIVRPRGGGEGGANSSLDDTSKSR